MTIDAQSLALRPGVVVDAEFEEPSEAPRFPEPPRGFAYLTFQGVVYLLRVAELDISEADEEQQRGIRGERPRTFTMFNFMIRLRAVARKVATL